MKIKSLLAAQCMLPVLLLCSVRIRADDRLGLEDNRHKDFTVNPGGKPIVDLNVGSINITTTPSAHLNIDVLSKVLVRDQSGERDEQKERDILQANEVTFSQDGDTVTVRARNRKASDSSHRGSLNFDVRYIISVPESFNVDLKTSGGGIGVQDVLGELNARTSGGGLKFTHIRGPIHAHTSGGGINLDDCIGSIKADTSGGSIDMGSGEGNTSLQTAGGSIRVHAHKGDLTAHTSGGGITIEQVDGKIDATTSGGSVSARLPASLTADCRLETSAGGITIELPETAGAEVEASTTAGSVHSDFAVTAAHERKHSSLKGQINGGGHLLVMHTSGGNIQLKKL